MKYLLSLVCIVFCCFELDAQELHTHNNAANFSNESNSTNGWTGGANISSVSDNPIDGSFCLRIESTPSNQRDTRYSFPAVIGEEYNISIWARTGNQSYKPAFANWQGVSGFTTRSIGGSNWSEYTFTVTATSSNPEIRIYVSPSSGGSPGNHIFVDRVSISPNSPADNEIPSAISDLNASNVGISSVSLNWTEPFDNIGVINYEVFQGNISLGLTGGSTSFNVSNLDANSNYSFYTIAIDAVGNRSTSSNIVNITTAADLEEPSPVTNLTSQNTTSLSTHLIWSASSDNVGVTDYEVFQDGQSIGFTGGTTSLNVISLSPNSTYSFTVFARDAVPNISNVSNTVIVNTPSQPDTQIPSTPANLQASNTTGTTIDLSWTESFDNVGVVNYEVFQDGLSIGFSNGSVSFNVNSLIPCTTYLFKVIAFDEAGNTSEFSNEEEITSTHNFFPNPTSPPSLANPIDNLTSSNLNSTSVTLNWSYDTQIGDRVLDYEVFQDDSSIGQTTGAATFNVERLNANTDYSFRVEPILCSDRITSGGSILNITTLEVPIVLNYDAENSNLPSVDWAARDLFADRNVGIGTSNNQGYRLAVAGNIVAEEIKVELQTNWPDFVFDEKYELPPLEKVEKHINQFGHLLNIPSSTEVEKNGIHLGEMNAKLLQKIEELTLYLIIQDKKIKNLENKIDQLNP